MQPYGMNGGESATRGKNILKLCKKSASAADGTNTRQIDRLVSVQRNSEESWERMVNLGGKSTVAVSPGDRLLILTPGGGGYGSPNATSVSSPWENSQIKAETVPVLTAGSLIQHDLNQKS